MLDQHIFIFKTDGSEPLLTDAQLKIEVGNALFKRLRLARLNKNLELCVEIEAQLSLYCAWEEMISIRLATIEEIGK